MKKFIAIGSMVGALAFQTVAVQACQFDDHSASLKQDQVASAMPEIKPATSEAMSTFDPKHRAIIEDTNQELKTPSTDKDIVE